jgi:hypothetical protein
MHEALMILSNNQSQKVTADRVQHQDFKRIFQCPECYATLTFRRSYTRNGHYVPAAFVHPRDGKPCKERVEYNFSSTQQFSPFELIKRGQNTKKLEKAFLRCVKYFMIGTQYSNNIPSRLNINELHTLLSKRYYFTIGDLLLFDAPSTEEWIITDSNFRKKIEYNQVNENIHKNHQLLIEAATKTISSKKLDIYFIQEIDKMKQFILADPQKLDFFANKKKLDWWKGFYEKVYNKNIDSLSVESLLDEHIFHVKGLIGYLRQGTSLDTKKKFFEMIIFGGLDFPVPRDIVWTQGQRDNYERRVWGNLFCQEVNELAQKAGIDEKVRILEYPDYILAQARQKASSSYPGVLLEHQNDIAQKREEAIKFLSLMSEEFLQDILNGRKLSGAISDFDSGKKTLGSQFINFFVSRQISLMRKYDWSVLPLFYEDTHFSF